MLVTNVTLIALFRLILHEKHASFVNIFQTGSSLYSSCLSLLLFTIIVFYRPFLAIKSAELITGKVTQTLSLHPYSASDEVFSRA